MHDLVAYFPREKHSRVTFCPTRAYVLGNLTRMSAGYRLTSSEKKQTRGYGLNSSNNPQGFVPLTMEMVCQHSKVALVTLLFYFNFIISTNIIVGFLLHANTDSLCISGTRAKGVLKTLLPMVGLDTKQE